MLRGSAKGDEVGEHHLDHRASTGQRGTHGKAHHGTLADRRIDDPGRAEHVAESGSRTKWTTVGDVLTEDDDVIVPLEFLPEGGGDGVDVSDRVRHEPAITFARRSPSSGQGAASASSAASSTAARARTAISSSSVSPSMGWRSRA